jgi:hypothetical protein
MFGEPHRKRCVERAEQPGESKSPRADTGQSRGIKYGRAGVGVSLVDKKIYFDMRLTRPTSLDMSPSFSKKQATIITPFMYTSNLR